MIAKKSIDMAREANFDHHLDMQIALSLKILNRVKEIERITKPLLKMNQKMLTEMKKYQKPPNGGLLNTFL
jgi:uridine kinase